MPIQGTIKVYNPANGRGAIRRDDGGPDVRFNADAYPGIDRREMRTGQRVTFDVAETDAGLLAVNMAVAG